MDDEIVGTKNDLDIGNFELMRDGKGEDEDDE